MLTSLLAGLSILVIGDSHLTARNYLIESLHMDLVRQGAQVHSFGVCGADAADWLKATPGTCGGAERRDAGPVALLGSGAATVPVTQLLSRDKPDLLVIVMGDTMAGYGKDVFPKAWIWQQVTSLTKAVGQSGTACVWVGPAWGTEGGKFHKTFARVEQMSAFLKHNVAPCAYIDSLGFSKPGAWATTDGQHFTEAGYRQWGDAIAKALAQSPAVQALRKK
ncbi:SGNH/GDSL hydrolase family protein [Castellaniella defragrans]|uniref:SGNH/GDSL hydrolase family protein n=1 Tax=Castellaniella defragrans TaxID=75697 RepID=UPI0023F23F09|nr:SGNH/GDSL hydrolase family protein [Castellaniella defragrans]